MRTNKGGSRAVAPELTGEERSAVRCGYSRPAAAFMS